VILEFVDITTHAPEELVDLKNGNNKNYQLPSKLLTSTVTPNFDRVSQIIVKILGAPQFMIGNLSQKLFSLKYFSLYKKKLRRVPLFVLHIFLHVGFCLSKLGFEKLVLIIFILREGVKSEGYGFDEITG
jgi:hypothetical protein